MKIFIILIQIVLFSRINCQLIVDAGPDKFFCRGTGLESPKNKNGLILGGNPTITGGTPPYKISWNCIVRTGFSTIGDLTASFFLNDTISSNPILKQVRTWYESIPLVIYVNVSDSFGHYAYDSLTLYNGGTFYAYDIMGYKNYKDTIEKCIPLQSFDTPVTYLWSPFKYMSDSTSFCTRFWNPINMIYYCKAIDKYQCESGFVKALEIIIDNNVAFIESNLNKIILNFHNPIYSTSIFEFAKSNNRDKVEIYNINGEKIYSEKQSDILEIGKLTRENGFYFIVFYNQDYGINTIKIQRK